MTMKRKRKKQSNNPAADQKRRKKPQKKSDSASTSSCPGGGRKTCRGQQQQQPGSQVRLHHYHYYLHYQKSFSHVTMMLIHSRFARAGRTTDRPSKQLTGWSVGRSDWSLISQKIKNNNLLPPCVMTTDRFIHP